MEIIEKYYINNGNVEEVETFNPAYIEGPNVIYEVIRIINGVPLFYEQHIERFKKSAEQLDYILPEDFVLELSESLQKIIEINGFPLKNVKLLVSIQNNDIHYLMYFIQSLYPSIDMYSNGVKATIAHIERTTPKIKLVNNIFKRNIARILEDNDAYEAILVNRTGYITEGSRSNVFILKERDAVTSPIPGILSGISRENIITICKEMHVNVIEREYTIEELLSADAVFICGTSPKILPVSYVDEHFLPSTDSHLMYSIMIEYSKCIEDYIESAKSKWKHVK